MQRNYLYGPFIIKITIKNTFLIFTTQAYVVYKGITNWRNKIKLCIQSYSSSRFLYIPCETIPDILCSKAIFWYHHKEPPFTQSWKYTIWCSCPNFLNQLLQLQYLAQGSRIYTGACMNQKEQPPPSRK